MAESIAFKVENVTKIYDDSIKAVNDLTLEVQRGAVGLLGPNGSGKSTLIKILMGLTDATEGTARVNGLDPTQELLQLRRSVGYMPENDCLPLDVNAVKVCSYFGQALGMSRVAALQRAHECLNYVNLGEARYREVKTYSTGMKQRLKLAQALVHDPELLFIDEPTNGLDPQGRIDMLALLSDLKAAGKGIIFCSHILPDIQQVCDRVIVLSLGSLKTSETIEELVESVQQKLVEARTNDTEKLSKLLEKAGLVIIDKEEVDITDPSSVVIEGVPEEISMKVVEICAKNDLELRRVTGVTKTLEDAFISRIQDENAEDLL